MNTNKDRHTVFSRILRKDLRCGVGTSTINAVSPGLIYKVPYQRCGSYDKISKMTYPAYLQRKANGAFAYSLPKTGEFLTRQGNSFKIPGNLITPTHQALPELNDRILIGELVVVDDKNNVLDRATGNGYINSFIKGEGDPEIAKQIRYYVWGFVTYQEFEMQIGFLSYSETFQQLEKWLPVLNSPIRLIETWIVKNFDEAQKQFKKLVAVGEEGAILKSRKLEFVWKDQSDSAFQMKMKAEAEAEFEVIGTYEGDAKKKYAGKLGGITVRSSCGQIVSDVGTGFTDVERDLGTKYWEDVKIVSVKFNGLTTDRNRPGVYALDHPRFVEVRLDKDEADTLEYCQKELLGK